MSATYDMSSAALRAAVNAECTCGGRGPDDGACQACMVWHRLVTLAAPDPARDAALNDAARELLRRWLDANDDDQERAWAQLSQALAPEPALKWHDEPSVTGWYWCALKGDPTDIAIVHVRMVKTYAPEGAYPYFSPPIPIDPRKCRFYGPLTEPRPADGQAVQP